MNVVTEAQDMGLSSSSITSQLEFWKWDEIDIANAPSLMGLLPSSNIISSVYITEFRYKISALEKSVYMKSPWIISKGGIVSNNVGLVAYFYGIIVL